MGRDHAVTQIDFVLTQNRLGGRDGGLGITDGRLGIGLGGLELDDGRLGRGDGGLVDLERPLGGVELGIRDGVARLEALGPVPVAGALVGSLDRLL